MRGMGVNYRLSGLTRPPRKGEKGSEMISNLKNRSDRTTATAVEMSTLFSTELWRDSRESIRANRFARIGNSSDSCESA